MSSLTLSGAMEDVNVGSGLTRSRLVVRRAVDWCRWKDSGDAPKSRYVNELDGNKKLGRLAYDGRETMVFISPSSSFIDLDLDWRPKRKIDVLGGKLFK